MILPTTSRVRQGQFSANQRADHNPTLDQRLRLGNDCLTHQQPKRIVDAVRDGLLQFAFMAEYAEAALEQAREHARCQDMVWIDDQAHGVDYRIQAAKAVEVTLLKRLKLAFGARQTG